MKKTYMNPEIDLEVLLTEDIITESTDDTGEDIFDVSQNVGTETGDDSAEDQFGAVAS